MNKTKKPEFVNLRMHNQGEEADFVIPQREKAVNDKLQKLVLKSNVLWECISEFIATFVLVFLGDCVIATLKFAHAENVGLAATPMGWGLALLVAVSVTGGASGCHANPAVTLAFATIGKVKWNRVLPYFLAQYLGAFLAAVMVFAVYYDSILDLDGGIRRIPPNINATAQIFATYPPQHVSMYAAFLDQIMATGILLMAIVAILDPRNLAIHKGLYPILIGFVLGAIVYALPYNCMAPLNPARDLSPRIFTLMAGYGTKVFSNRGYVYFMVPIIGPHIGALLGVWIYKLGIDIHRPIRNQDVGGLNMLNELEDSEGLDESPSVPTAPLINVDR